MSVLSNLPFSSLIGILILIMQIISIVSKKLEKISFLNLHEKDKLIIIFMSIMIFVFEAVSYYSKSHPDLINLLPIVMMIITVLLLGVFTLGKITETKSDSKPR